MNGNVKSMSTTTTTTTTITTTTTTRDRGDRIEWAQQQCTVVTCGDAQFDGNVDLVNVGRRRLVRVGRRLDVALIVRGTRVVAHVARSDVVDRQSTTELRQIPLGSAAAPH